MERKIVIDQRRQGLISRNSLSRRERFRENNESMDHSMLDRIRNVTQLDVSINPTMQQLNIVRERSVADTPVVEALQKQESVASFISDRERQEELSEGLASFEKKVYALSESPNQKWFIKMVYLYQGIVHLTVALFCLLPLLSQGFRESLEEQTWVVAVAICTALLVLLASVVFRRICLWVPLNYALLVVFILAKCFVVSFVAIKTWLDGTFLFIALVGSISVATFGVLCIRVT